MLKKTNTPRVGYLLRCFPKISETFILNEILQLEEEGLNLKIYSMKESKEEKTHQLVDNVRATISYLPRPFPTKLKNHFKVHRKLLFKYFFSYIFTFLKILRMRDEKLKQNFIQAGYLIELLETDQVEHLHAGFVNDPGSIAWIAHQITGIPYSLTSHARDLYLSCPKLLKKKVAKARLLFTCTKYNIESLNALLPPSHLQRICHVYHGSNLEYFLFGEYGIARPPLILSVARLVEKKGLRVLIRACGILKNRIKNFHCAIIGEGSLRPDLIKLINALDLNDIVTLKGVMDQDSIKEWYRKATIFALPCIVTEDGDRDGIPNVLVEAAASGTPIVTTNVSGISELITDEETGLLVEPNDPKKLARAIERLLNSPELCERLRHQARQVVEERFDLKKNAKLIGQELKNILKSRKSR